MGKNPTPSLFFDSFIKRDYNTSLLRQIGPVTADANTFVEICVIRPHSMPFIKIQRLNLFHGEFIVSCCYCRLAYGKLGHKCSHTKLGVTIFPPNFVLINTLYVLAGEVAKFATRQVF